MVQVGLEGWAGERTELKFGMNLLHVQYLLLGRCWSYEIVTQSGGQAVKCQCDREI